MATRRVTADVRPTGIEVEKIYLVGSLGLPETVERSISAKIAATEKAILRENELRQAEAEAKNDVHKGEIQAAVAFLCNTSRSTEVRLSAPDPKLWAYEKRLESDEAAP